MKLGNNLKVVVLFSSLSTGACFVSGLASASEAGGLIESAQQKAYEIGGKDVATLKFDKGKSTLSSGDQSELRTMYNAVKEDSRVTEIIVAAYSDLPYPKSKKSELPTKSRQLADKRGTEVSKFLNELGAKNVRVVNMAERATWLDRTFDTKEAQVKRESSEMPSKANTDDLFYESLGRHLQKSGAPSDVVVIIRHD